MAADAEGDRLGVSGIEARFYMMLPAEIRTKRSAAEMQLRELLGSEPGYDWRAGLPPAESRILVRPV